MSGYQAKDKARYSRAQWMEKFESACIKLDSRQRGRIDWNTGEYFYLKGYSPNEAAKEWLHYKTGV